MAQVLIVASSLDALRRGRIALIRPACSAMMWKSGKREGTNGNDKRISRHSTRCIASLWIRNSGALTGHGTAAASSLSLRRVIFAGHTSSTSDLLLARHLIGYPTLAVASEFKVSELPPSAFNTAKLKIYHHLQRLQVRNCAGIRAYALSPKFRR